MELLSQLLDLILHLDKHLKGMVDHLGPWPFYLVLFLVIFCETGLVIMPFLPGDSLLFALGALCAGAGVGLDLTTVLVLMTVAAVLGDALNYTVGAFVGPRIFRSEKSWLFNKKHLLRSQEFYERYGSKTIILARFVPIVRTFAPFVAGIGRMSYPKFLAYNVVGAVAWVGICVGAGVWFGEKIWVQEHFGAVVFAVVVISVLPMAVEVVLAWRKSRREKVVAVTEVVGKREETLHKAG